MLNKIADRKEKVVENLGKECSFLSGGATLTRPTGMVLEKGYVRGFVGCRYAYCV
jgi:hypothetical protein